MKIIYLFIGFIALFIGGVGVVLPILPTTPFLILSAFCFAKSSKKVEKWFKSTKIYRNNIESLVKGDGMSRKAKCNTIMMVTGIMVIALVMMRNTTFGSICIACVWLAHVIGFVFFVKTTN